MTPEELVATREDANVDYAPEITYDDWQAMARALLTHIDSQAAQIAALKEKLVEERAKYVHQRDREAKFGGLIHELDKGKYYDEAHQQLADEMPGVTWE